MILQGVDYKEVDEKRQELIAIVFKSLLRHQIRFYFDNNLISGNANFITHTPFMEKVLELFPQTARRIPNRNGQKQFDIVKIVL